MTTVLSIQTALARLGFDPGPLDDKIGPKTLTAIAAALASIGPEPAARHYDVVPATWMPTAEMKRIIVHWTAGGWKASPLDREHYHIAIEDDGRLVRCDHSIEDNVNTADDDYAAHTRGCNSGSIGVTLCGMLNAVERPFNAGRYPITEKQWDVLSSVCADLCGRYGIPVTPRTVLSHAEVQDTLGIAQRGKWDIAVLPFDLAFNTATKCGDRLRAETVAKINRT